MSALRGLDAISAESSGVRGMAADAMFQPAQAEPLRPRRP
jgi:hypothetical protein